MFMPSVKWMEEEVNIALEEDGGTEGEREKEGLEIPTVRAPWRRWWKAALRLMRRRIK